MALINLNINTFKRDSGILNRLTENVTQQVENRLENAVEDLIGGALNKAGLSSVVASQISTRFGDAFAAGSADRYFREFNSEINRVTPRETVQNMLPADGAETYVDAIQRASNTKTITGAQSTLQYPEQIGKYYMAMKFAEYRRPAPESRATLDFIQAFALPIPRELKETININVNESSEQGFMGGAANMLTNTFGGGGAGLGTNLVNSGGALAYSYAVQKLGQFNNEVSSILTQVLGAVPNPHVQAIFEGIPLRSHRFDWTFSPRNAEESMLLQKLILALKAYSLPSYTRLGTAALQYPMLCQIELYPWSKDVNAQGNEVNKDSRDPTNLIVFKPAILKSVDINYSPQGLPAFFAGTNFPTMISLSLEFVETEIHTSNMYGRQGNSSLDENVDNIMNGINQVVSSLTGGQVTDVVGEVEEVLNDVWGPESAETPE